MTKSLKIIYERVPSLVYNFTNNKLFHRYFSVVSIIVEEQLYRKRVFCRLIIPARDLSLDTSKKFA